MEEPKFNTNSVDPKERIAARDARIETNKNKLLKSNDGNKDDGKKQEDMGRGKHQVAVSLANLDALKAQTIDVVTQVRIETDDAENRRRIAEERKRDERLHALREEAVRSTERNEMVEKHWDELGDIHMPQALQQEIDYQRKACERILASKDNLIKQFQLELKVKDEEYVKMLKRQSEDVEELLGRMRSQFSKLQEHYAREVESCERAFLGERSEVLQANLDKINALYESRRNMELQYMETKQEREEKYMAEIAMMRVKDSEDYNKLKIKLETDIQVLEQQLQEMRATYQLNTEKLEYNYRVLTERDMENTATLQQQKRRLGRLKEQLTNLTNKYNKSDGRFKAKNAELTEEYRRSTKQYKDLQKKFQHFQVADNSKYDQVWAMHEEEVQELVDKVLQADKIIVEQQLGLRWVAPAQSASGGMAALAATAAAKAAAKAKAEVAVDPAEGKDGAGEPKASGAAEAVAAVSRKSKVTNEKVRRMLDLLCKEAGFLVPSDVRAQMDAIGASGAGELAVLEADAVLQALSVSTEEDVTKLLAYFFDKTSDEDEMFDDDAAAVTRDLGIKVTPDEIVAVIRAFMDAKAAEAEADEASPVAKIIKVRAEEEGGGAGGAAAAKRRQEADFWRQMADVVDGEKVCMWEALEAALQSYNKVLNDRSQCIEDVNSLRSQNEELKALLNQYLGAKVNDELQIPPTQMIRLGGM